MPQKNARSDDFEGAKSRCQVSLEGKTLSINDSVQGGKNVLNKEMGQRMAE